MLKTLNGELLHSVEEAGKQAKAISNAANNKASQCLSITSRLEAQQGNIHYLHVVSLTYAFGWSAFLYRIRYVTSLIAFF
jgi:hypothetical protein